jgi:pyruvate formate lyase activating enzyme
MEWRKDSRVASFWKFQPEQNKVMCNLCPRHCTLKEGQKGFCLVRGNVENELHTYNYGRSVQATIECIETEAINHFSPGAKILSMGNIGCMMACHYCQNWQTSQIKHLDDKNVKIYTPEEVIDLALANNIKIISWTYNDPVVWQEFVVDTSRLAQKNGIKTLYKSALYIETEPLEELIDVIDIFSVSLKCMNPEVYKKYTKGELEPVLKAIKQIYDSKKHLEISQLIVTELNDDGIDAKKTAQWMMENLDESIPLHLVAYHPAFRYNKERTSTETLLTLRNIVLEEGLKYCYLGNVYDDGISDTNCTSCNEKLVERFGLSVHIKSLNEDSCCTKCGAKSPIIEVNLTPKEVPLEVHFISQMDHHYNWTHDIKSLHISVEDNKYDNLRFKVTRLPNQTYEYLELNKGLERLIISKSENNETGIEISIDHEAKVHFLPVLDRAHFPTAPGTEHNSKYIN